MDAHHLRDLVLAIRAGRPGLAAAVALSEAGDQVLAQLALGEGVDRVVDGLVGDVHVGFVGEHGLECPRDLLRRPQPAQKMADHRPQHAFWAQLPGRPGLHLARQARPLRWRRGVAIGCAIALQFPAQRGRTAFEQGSDLSQALPLLPQRRQRHAFFGLQLSISFRHPHTLPVW